MLRSLNTLFLIAFMSSLSWAVGLSGTYVINENGTGDYLTLTDAVDDAELLGLSGHTTFLVENSYSSEVSIGAIPNASAQRKLFIEGEIASNEVAGISLVDAKWLVISKLTLSNTLPSKSGIMLWDAHRIVIRECEFVSEHGVLFGSGLCKYITIKENSFTHADANGSGYGINGQWLVDMRNITVSNNVFDGYYNTSIGFAAGRNLTISENQIDHHKASLAAVSFSNTTGLVNFRRNRILTKIADTSNTTGGLAIVNGVNVKVTNNMITSNGTAIKTSSGSGNLIAHNSIRSVYGTGIFLICNDAQVLNNAIYSSGVCLDVFSCPILSSDHNSYYSDGTVELQLGYTPFSNLSSWQSFMNVDHNSMFEYPYFLSNTDLHLSFSSPLIDQGSPLSQVPQDYDGGNRGTTVDIGADEAGVKKALTNSTMSISMNRLELDLYPNPNKGQFSLTGDFSSEAIYQIIDLHGRTLAASTIGKGRVNMIGLESGRYIVRLTEGHRTGTASFIIE